MSNLLTLIRYVRNIRHVVRAKKYNRIEINKEDIPHVRLRVRGRGNVIKIGKLASRNGVLTIRVYAENTTIEIGEGLNIASEFKINVRPIRDTSGALENCHIQVGEELNVQSATVVIYNSNAKLEIGKCCLFSSGITIYHTDGHPIYAYDTDSIVNRVKNLSIGEHVWIGANVTILKNSVIPSGCVVGWGSVVSGRFNQENMIIAGNPASVRSSRKVDWKVHDLRYVENEFEV